MTAVSQFRFAITSELRRRALVPANGRGKGGRSLHLLLIPTSPKATVVYVKESNTDRPGFWGRNHIDRLESNGGRWFVVLLRHSASSGYLLSGGQVLRRVQAGLFELAGDGEYRVPRRVCAGSFAPAALRMTGHARFERRKKGKRLRCKTVLLSS